jgi:hypothetical protein
MKELTDRLVTKTGITPAQAMQCIETVKEYIKEKFPIAAGAVDKVLGAENVENEPDNY